MILFLNIMPAAFESTHPSSELSGKVFIEAEPDPRKRLRYPGRADSRFRSMVNTWVEFAINGARDEDRNNMAVIWILLGMPTSFDGEHLTQSILSDPLIGGNERSAEGRTSGAMTSCVAGVVLKSGSKGRS